MRNICSEKSGFGWIKVGDHPPMAGVIQQKECLLNVMRCGNCGSIIIVDDPTYAWLENIHPNILIALSIRAECCGNPHYHHVDFQEGRQSQL